MSFVISLDGIKTDVLMSTAWHVQYQSRGLNLYKCSFELCIPVLEQPTHSKSMRSGRNGSSEQSGLVAAVELGFLRAGSYESC